MSSCSIRYATCFGLQPLKITGTTCLSPLRMRFLKDQPEYNPFQINNID